MNWSRETVTIDEMGVFKKTYEVGLKELFIKVCK